MQDFLNQCPVCGKPLPTSNRTGQCPFCLLQLGLSASLGTGNETSGTTEFFIRQGVLPAFDDYLLEAEIGRGGMGVVYRARQISLDRQVAIKMILSGQLASPEMIERFRFEAQSASKLRHPGIIPIYEIGEWETQHYFSMELVDGASLAQCIEDFRLNERGNPAERKLQQITIAELMTGVARALDFAHKRGVLHRDVKPSNILIDEHGHPRLTDFGLVKLIGKTGGGSAAIGTPGYAAPEQARGVDADLTIAADVYALGATLYQLLTGRPPFTGSSASDTLRQAAENPPKPPRQINPAVHPDMQAIALQCLQIKPADRYPSAEAVADDLQRFVDARPVSARRIGRAEQTIRWCRRNPGMAMSILMLVIAITIGTTAVLWQTRQVQHANVQLSTTVADLKWNSINDMLKQGQASTALATVASIIRQNPADPGPIMFAMSLLEQRRFPLPVAPQISHPDQAALSVARMSPDGKRIATASFDGTVRIWDAKSSEQLLPPLKHDGAVNWTEFSPDGASLVSCSQDKMLRLWDVQTGNQIWVVDLGEPVVRGHFSSDGSHLLAWTKNNLVMVNPRTGKLLYPAMVLPGSIPAAGFLNDNLFFYAESNVHASHISTRDAATGIEQADMPMDALQDADLNHQASRAAVIDGDGRAWVMDFPTGQNRHAIAKDETIQRVIFSPSGNRVAALALAHWARVFDAERGEPVTSEFPHNYVLNGACFFDDEHKLLTWSSDSVAQVWDIDRGKPDCEPMRHTHRLVYAEAPVIDGQQYFLTTQTHSRGHALTAGLVDSATGAVQLWSAVDRRNPLDRILATDFPSFDATRFSPDGKLVAYGTSEGAAGEEEIRVVDPVTQAQFCPPMPVHGGAWNVFFSPDGSQLIGTTASGQLTSWSLPAGTPRMTPITLPEGIYTAEMSNDGKLFATGGPEGSIRIWDTATCQQRLLMHHHANIHSLAFSGDGSLLASAGADRITRIWNTQTGEQVRELVGHTSEVMTVFFSPDDKKLITGSFDFTARIWDATTGKTLAVLPHRGEVLDVAFSPDGKYVATGSRDCTAAIWDATTGIAHFHTAPFDTAVRNVRFSPDSSRLFTLDFHGLQVWDAASGHPLTVHMHHEMAGGTGLQTSSLRFDLTSDGQEILLGADSLTLQLLRLPDPPANPPVWFPEFLESVAGDRLTTAADLPEPINRQEFLKLASQLRQASETDYFTTWAKQWLAMPGAPLHP